MNQLLEGFWSDYGLIIILIGAFVLFMLFYYLRSKKYQDSENSLHSSLKKGDKVKTYSGFYGTVEKIVETTDGKVVTLALGGDAFVDVDVRAIAGIDEKQEIVEDEQPADEAQADEAPVEAQPEEEAVEAPVEEVAEEKAEEKAEETTEEKPAEEPKPKKRGRKAKAE
ncbi:MAG: preprotein translocase subunit YajC [Clostridia bacterium]|nr:preprotein translocase subunit YajC [Clostridia bacterium]